MKVVNVEFPAGTSVFILNGNQPVQTKVRAAQWTNSMNSKGVESEKLVYSTVINPNLSLTSDQLAATKEELMNKVFGNNVAGAVAEGQKKESKKPAEKISESKI